MWRFPFGRPVLPRAPSASGARPVFILGAYPSAIHVRWTPPAPYKVVRAIAVDNEPTPFWDGADQARVVDAWKAAVGFDDSWGSVYADPKFNGPCGQDVVARILGPLRIAADDACITDCLDTYRGSVGGNQRIADTYNPWAVSARLPLAAIPPHPSEAAIVSEAVASHRGRLRGELDVARPDVVVTLGNAALRVMRELLDEAVGPPQLALPGYGEEHAVRLGGRLVRWLPLAHPAAPARYQTAHDAWMRRTLGVSGSRPPELVAS